MPRIRSTTTLTSRARFDATVDEICRLQLDHESRVTERDQLLADVRERHDPEIERLAESISSKIVLCEKYAETHRDSLFLRGKSAASSLGIFGFRVGNPTLKLLNRKWKWADVVETLKAKGMFGCVRVREDADKDALKKLDPSELAAVGCRIDQVETFFIEPKRDDPERITP